MLDHMEGVPRGTALLQQWKEGVLAGRSGFALFLIVQFFDSTIFSE